MALIQACASGDLTAVRALIAKDPSLARSHYDYRKPLYFAVRENRVEVVRFLLEHALDAAGTGAADAMAETFAQLDELLLTLGASGGRS